MRRTKTYSGMLPISRRSFVAGAAAASLLPRTAHAEQKDELVSLGPDANSEDPAPETYVGALMKSLRARGMSRSEAHFLSRQPGAAVSQSSLIGALSSIQMFAGTNIPVRAGVSRNLAVGAPIAAPPQTVTFDQLHIEWPDDAHSVDVAHMLSDETRHLGSAPAAGAIFQITPELLGQICANNSFVPLDRARSPNVLFGIRGVEVSQNQPKWSGAVSVRLAVPDHETPKCVIGVWHRSSNGQDQICAFTGSTVPNAHFMTKHVRGPNDVCNLPPTGFHRFLVGTHRGFQGAFKQGTPYPPHRLPFKLAEQPSLSTLTYTTEVTPHSRPHLYSKKPIVSVGVDLHPAFETSVRAPLEYSSAGCQTVRGDQYIRTRTGEQVPAGDWAGMRVAAGLVMPISHHDDGKEYDYLLISGREAYLTSKVAAGSALQRFRFGSIDDPAQPTTLFGGVTVRNLQLKLASEAKKHGAFADIVSRCCLPGDFAADGKFFGGLMRVVLAWQAAHSGTADGIVTSNMIDALQLR